MKMMCRCIAKYIPCTNYGCEGKKPHDHGDLCTVHCVTCGGYGIPVRDPEDHGWNHLHLQHDPSQCRCGKWEWEGPCPLHYSYADAIDNS